MEKLLKTIDTLKTTPFISSDAGIPGNISSSVQAVGDSVKTKKNERISHCKMVTEAVCQPSTQENVDFTKIMEVVTEVLFQLCNDSDPDIRLVASDSLNKIVKAMQKEHLMNKLLEQILREILRCSEPRSLKIAYKILSYNCPRLRLVKSSETLHLLLPCLDLLSRRSEEILYEGLHLYVDKIMLHLGPFMTEQETQNLLRTFTSNLYSGSGVVRRSTALILLAICKHSNSPEKHLPWFLQQILDALLPNFMDKRIHMILGSLTCIKYFIPAIYELMSDLIKVDCDGIRAIIHDITKIYELSMMLCNHDNHNVATSCLETIQQLFEKPPFLVYQMFTSPRGIDSKINSNSPKSICSNGKTEEGTEDIDVKSSTDDSISSEGKQCAEIADSSIELSLVDLDTSQPSDCIRKSASGSSLEIFNESDEENKRSNVADQDLFLESVPDILMGSLYEKDVPLKYCIRFLTYNFLLSGRKTIIRADSEVKVSSKSVAIGCVINILEMYPSLYQLPLSQDLDSDELKNGQTVEDISLFCSHHDPLLRGLSFMFVGKMIKQILIEFLSNEEFKEAKMIALVNILIKGLKDHSNVAVKLCINAIKACFNSLLTSNTPEGTIHNLFKSILTLQGNKYWVVHVGLAEFVSCIDWSAASLKSFSFDEQNACIDCLIHQLLDEDARVRSAATGSIIKLLENLLHCSATAEYMQLKSMSSSTLYSLFFGELDLSKEVICSGQVIKRKEYRESSIVGRVLHYLLNKLELTGDRNDMIGVLGAISRLSSVYEPKKYRSLWKLNDINKEEPTSSLLVLCLDALQASDTILDSQVHQNLLNLSCNLFLACEFTKDISFEDDENLAFNCAKVQDSKLGTQLLGHCMNVIKLYQHMANEVSSIFSLKKVIQSPVISPVRKFSQRLDSEKKIIDLDSDNKLKSTLWPKPANPVQMKRLQASVKQGYKVYEISTDEDKDVRYTSLLSAGLNSFATLCVIVRPNHPSLPEFIESSVSCLSNTLRLCPIDTLKAIKQLLRFVFLAFNLEDEASHFPDIETEPNYSDPMKMFLRASGLNASELDKYNHINNGPHGLSNKNAFASLFSLFEPVIVSGLRMYTSSSDPAFQYEILGIMNLLIRCHINYGKIDTNQAFLQFVLKHCSYFIEGQCRDYNLLEKMFRSLSLIHLSNENIKSKEHIGFPKIISLLEDVLAAAEKKPFDFDQSMLLSCFTPVVQSFFFHINDEHASNLCLMNFEKKRQALAEITCKVPMTFQGLHLLWIILKSRSLSFSLQSKLEEFSKIAIAKLIKAVNDNVIFMKPKHLGLLVATLQVAKPFSFPPTDNIIGILNDCLESQSQDLSSFFQWSNKTIFYWLIFHKQYPSWNEKDSETTSKLIFQLMFKWMADVNHFGNHSFFDDIHTEPALIFFHTVVQMLDEINSEDDEAVNELGKCLAKVMKTEYWLQLSRIIRASSKITLSFARSYCRIVSKIVLPDKIFWEDFFSVISEVSSTLVETTISLLVKQLNKMEHSNLEELIIKKFPELIVRNIHKMDFKNFVNRLSSRRLEQLVSGIMLLQCTDFEYWKRMLIISTQINETFPYHAVEIGFKIIKECKSRFLIFETSHMLCNVLATIKIRKMLSTSKERDQIKALISDPFINQNHLRLTEMVREVLNLSKNASSSCHGSLNLHSLIASYIEDANAVNCHAVVVMLSSLDQGELVLQFRPGFFNTVVLQGIFKLLYNRAINGELHTKDRLLFYNEEEEEVEQPRFTTHNGRLYFLSIQYTKSWLLAFENEYLNKISESTPATQETWLREMPIMWVTIGYFLRTINSFPMSDVEGKTRQVDVSKSFFLNSFMHMETVARERKGFRFPSFLFRDFLFFVSSCLEDNVFWDEINAPENAPDAVKCIKAFITVANRFNGSSHSKRIRMTGLFASLGDEAKAVLNELEAIVTLVQKRPFRSSVKSTDESLWDLFRMVLAGLCRLEVINGWILSSHIDWRPILSDENKTIFPKMSQLPLEVIRGDKEVLLEYIWKLNFIGVSNKMQYEENWVIFLSVINFDVDQRLDIQTTSTGLKAISMLVSKAVKVKCTYNDEATSEAMMKKILKLDEMARSIEPSACKIRIFDKVYPRKSKEHINIHSIDLNSCIRFLTDLYSQWLQNSQEKIPLFLLSEVLNNIVELCVYFDDVSLYFWMYETFLEAYKSLEGEDDNIWPHVLYGLFRAASEIELDAEDVNVFTNIIVSSLSSPCLPLANAAVNGCLVYLQNQSKSNQVISTICCQILTVAQTEDRFPSESHVMDMLYVMAFAWLNKIAKEPSFDQKALKIFTDTIRNSKYSACVKILCLKVLQLKICDEDLSKDDRKKILRLSLELFSTRNVGIFYENLKLYMAIFYHDFYWLCGTLDPDPEAMTQMIERCDVLFNLLHSNVRLYSEMTSKFFPLLIEDFLPPSEILNKIMALFMSPSQTSPELIAPVLSKVFSKAKRRPREAVLVREWIVASLPHIMGNLDFPRTLWSLSLLFIGISQSQNHILLPLAEMRRKRSESKDLLKFGFMDFYSTLDRKGKSELRSMMESQSETKEKNPYKFLLNSVFESEEEDCDWPIDPVCLTLLENMSEEEKQYFGTL